MSKGRRTEAEMIAALKQIEAEGKAEVVAESESIEAHDPCLGGEVRRYGCKPGEGGGTVAR